MIKLKDLTVDEKIQLLTGIDDWRLTMLDGKLPEVFLSDGPHGLRRVTTPNEGGGETTVYATAMPNVVNLGNSWDKDLVKLNSSTIADDCVEKGSDVLLAPGVNIKRSPPSAAETSNIFRRTPYLPAPSAKPLSRACRKKASALP